MPDDFPSSKFGSSSLLQPAKVRFKRLMQEGFRGFLITLFFFSTGVTLTTVYFHEKADLDEAVRNETIKLVGTRQEPSDAAADLGLIAAALAKVNATPPPPFAGCSEPQCTPAEELPGRLVELAMPKVIAAVRPHLDADGDWINVTGEVDNLIPHKQNSDVVSWPELRQGPICSGDGDQTFLMIPVQVGGLHKPYFTARVAAAADISKFFFFDTLRDFLRKNPAGASVVQTYFISPDSLLRMWTSRRSDVCSEFPKARLWASKNYYTQFWEGDPKEQYSTLAYIDYGGNGLVRTSCHAVELPGNFPEHSAALTDFPRGHFLGILCMDFKLSDPQIDLMKSQLFFEVADVKFQIRGTHELGDIAVKLVSPQPGLPPAAPPRNSEPQPSAASTLPPAGAPGAQNGWPPDASAKPAAYAKADAVLRAAIGMQASTLNEGAVEESLNEELNGKDLRKLLREVTRITYKGNRDLNRPLDQRDAFLLPLGESNGSFHGLFFYPRSPVLPLWATLVGFAGILFGGAGMASFFYNWRSQNKITELRKRIALFRNLQVGVVQVDPNDYIVECNDRAEELVGRRLPKPGVDLDTPLNFQQLFPFRVRLENGHYETISPGDINRLRKSGKASSYWACLSVGSAQDGSCGDSRPKWLFVRATPIMEPEAVRRHSENGMDGAHAKQRDARKLKLYGVFATISEAFPERIPHLDAVLKSQPVPQEGEQ